MADRVVTVGDDLTLPSGVIVPASRIPDLPAPPTVPETIDDLPDGAARVAMTAAERVALAATPDAIASAVAAERRLRPIAQRTAKWVKGGSPDNLSNGASTGITTQLLHTCDISASGLRLVFSNIYNAGGIETDGPNDITVKANVRLSGGLNFPVYFAGRRSAVIEPGGVLVSDPVGLAVTKGATFYTRTFVSVAAGGKYPLHVKTDSATEGVNAGDLADGSVMVNSVRGYGPHMILGTPSVATSSPVVLASGDSITAGWSDLRGTGNSVDDFGWLDRALDGVLSHANIAISSSTVGNAITGNNASRRLRVADVVSYDAALVLYGTNDLAGAAGATGVEAALIAWWTMMANRGMRVFAGTVPPLTTASTDSWATEANQTIHAQNATRVAVNAWLRDGAPYNASTKVPLAVGAAGLRAGEPGHLLARTPWDFADAVESARDSGRWRAGYTIDGTHPGNLGAAAMAALVDPTTIGPTL